MAEEQKTQSKAQEEAVAVEATTTGSFWMEEEQTPHLALKMALKSVMFNKKSPFQHSQVIETFPFGKTLVLDGKTQSAQRDEKSYHEALVHPAMLAHGSPKSVYIGGGGELATARETLRWKTVEKVVMVDIDEIVVNVCKEQLPEWNDGCVEDPRLEVHYDDAKGFLERYEGKFDVIIMDIADPIEAGPGIMLYTKEFYDFAISKLNPGGVFVTQSGPGSFLVVDECGTVIHQTLKGAFQHVAHYAADVPSFGSNWGFNVAYNDDCAIAKSSSAAGRDPALYFLEAPLKEIDDALEQNLKGGLASLQMLDAITIRGLFGVNRSIRKQDKEEKRIMTKDNPVFMY